MDNSFSLIEDRADRKTSASMTDITGKEGPERNEWNQDGESVNAGSILLGA